MNSEYRIAAQGFSSLLNPDDVEYILLTHEQLAADWADWADTATPNLQPGETKRYGGGAQPIFEVTRACADGAFPRSDLIDQAPNAEQENSR